MRLRPHHVLDIVTGHGTDQRLEPHPYGHSLHSVAARLLGDLSVEVELVVAADAVCDGCRHLREGRCEDVLAQLTPSPSKHAYNEVVDCRLLDDLGLPPGVAMPAWEFLARVNQRLPGLERICTHPKEDERQRLAALCAGLVRLGVRSPA